MPSQASLHALVAGRVQGVFFRAFVERHALRLGLSGYVRNLRDGRVEVWVEGEKAGLEELLGHLHRGPPGARVEGVEVEWGGTKGAFRGFEVRY